MFTVKKFLRLPQVEWHRMLAGAGGADARPIEHVARIEAPVDNFVRENELALSTILGFRDDPKAIGQFIRDVHARGACALAISVPGDSINLPPEVVAYPDLHNFPVILLPWEWRFSEIVDLVLEKIQENTNQRISFFEETQRAILAVYLANKNLDAAAATLAEAGGGQVGILDADKKPLGQSPTGAPAGGAGECQWIEIRNDSRLYGYLTLKIQDEAAGGGHEAIFWDRYIIPILMLWFNKEWLIQVTRQSVKDDFVWKLAKGEINVDRQTLAQAKLLGFDLELPYVCVVGQIRHIGCGSKSSEEKWICDHINLVKEEILKAGQSLGLAVMLTYQMDTLIIFTQTPAFDKRSSLNGFLDGTEKRLANIFPRLRFYWGIGDANTGQKDMARQYINAKLSLDICRNSVCGKNRYAFEDTIIFRLLSYLAENEPLRAVMDNAVRPLLTHGDGGIELLKTLKEYIKNGNVSEIARRLGIHRQTVLYRLDKIENLTGYSLKDHDDLFFLELCVRLYLDFKDS